MLGIEEGHVRVARLLIMLLVKDGEKKTDQRGVHCDAAKNVRPTDAACRR
jgi:hypothetical protein